MTIKEEAYYDATLNQSETFATNETYNLWRRKNPTKRPYLDANKLVSSKPKKRKAGNLEKEITRKLSDLSILTEIKRGSNIKRTKRDQI